jgi:hypothetical protein
MSGRCALAWRALRPAARGPWSRRGLGVLVVLAAVLPAGSRAEESPAREFTGACYCRVQRELFCTANLTERQCDLRSKQAFCDDWFWKERLPCWNWGYGG